MFNIEHEITVQRPIEEVFAFVSDPSHYTEWQAELIDYRQTSPGPLGVGAMGVNVRQEMGRRIETTWEMSSYVPNKQFAIRSTSGPISYEIANTFAPTEAGTQVEIQFKGDARGFFKLAEPLVMGSIIKSVERDYGRLKQILESR